MQVSEGQIDPPPVVATISPYRLGGKTAIVTGAAQGIGRAICERFGMEGANVVAVDINPAHLVGFSAETITARECDAADEKAIEQLSDEFEQVDILVNCAGWVHQGTLLECSSTDWRKSFHINVDSVYAASRAALRRMIERKSGSIINIASIASSVKAAPSRAAYASSKAAIIGLTKSIACDYVSSGIRCNAICPGMVASPSLRERINSLPDPEAALSGFLARQPIGRFGSPAEVASLAAYLASDESYLMTGAILVMDGGSSN